MRDRMLLRSTPLGRFLEGRHVLVTGHTGLVGTWLCRWLLESGAKPVGFARRCTDRASGMRSIAGDIRSRADVVAAVTSSAASLVIHLAALAATRQGPELRHATYETNVIGTVNVLEAVEATPDVLGCVIVGSSRGPRVGGGDPQAGDPYNASKAAMEPICLQYRQELLGQVPARGVAIARPGVLIGGADASERLVPSVMRSLLQGEVPHLLTAGAVRPWQHVLEACSGMLWLAAQLVRTPAETGPAYDFGLADPRGALPAGELARRLTTAWGGGTGPGPAVAAEIGYTQDCVAADADLGWTPVWTIDQAVERVVEWYRAPTDAEARRRVISSQVHSYVRDAVRSGTAWAADRP